jgi:hypothetical protein
LCQSQFLICIFVSVICFIFVIVCCSTVTQFCVGPCIGVYLPPFAWFVLSCWTLVRHVCSIIAYTRSVQKVSDLGPGKKSSVSGWLQYLIPFKVGPL